MFHHQRIAEYASIMSSCAEEAISNWQVGETRSIHKDMMELTLRIVVKIFFGFDLGDKTDELRVPLNALTKGASGAGMLLPSFLRFLPMPGMAKFRRTVRHLDSLVYDIIEDRSVAGMPTPDLLSMLLEARDEDGSGLTKEQVRDEVITFLIAGHGTTAMALSWTCFLLSQHWSVDVRLHDELKRVLNGRMPRFEDLPYLDYTGKVVRESMRLYPPGWAFGRTALRECEIGGYRIPKGAEVLACPWTLHRDCRFFDNPEQFDPDRWGSPRTRNLPKFAYFPFGGGGRMCIGASFAMTEATIVLAAIAQKFRLRLAEGHPVVPSPGLTLGPKYGIKMVVDGLR
jgi:cytochrome P450